MLTKLIKFLKGYVVIRLTGYSPERFLNLCSYHHIVLWGLQSVGMEYEMCMSIQSFRKLRPLVHKTRTKVVILERHGLPFMLHRYRTRKIFPVGCLAGAILLYIMSLYVWNIHVEGNYHLSDQVILDYLELQDVVHGMPKRSVYCEMIETLLREHFAEITWTSAEVNGTRLIIHIQENENVTESQIAEDKPADLAASESGTIVSMIVRSGTPLVSEGDEVKKGDILVQSRVEILDDTGTVSSAYYVHADADIRIQRYAVYRSTFPMQYTKKVYTGETQTSYYVQFGQKRVSMSFPFFEGYEFFDEMTSEYPLKLTENYYLPLSFAKTVRHEYFPEEAVYTKEEAFEKAKEDLSLFFEKLGIKGLQIIENNVRIDMNGDVCTAVGTYLVEESAVREQTPQIMIPDQEMIPDEEREQS